MSALCPMAIPSRGASTLTLRRPLASFVFALAVVWGQFEFAALAAAQSLSFQAIAPCRIIDTRRWNAQGTPTANPFAAGERRNFELRGPVDLRRYGGDSATGCGLPSGTQAINFLGPYAEAVALNIIAVAPQGPGNLRAFPGSLATAPNASVLNYDRVAGLNLSALALVSLTAEPANGNFDQLAIQADASATHVVVDVVGYFVRGISTTVTGQIVAIPAGVSGTHWFALPNGLATPQATAPPARMRIPNGCRVGNLAVRELTPPGSNQFRTYNLVASTGQAISCGTQGNSNVCASASSFVAGIPSGGDVEIHFDVILTGSSVPATDAAFTWQLSCD